MLRLSLTIVALGLADVFGRLTDQEWEEQEMALLRESAEEAGESLTYDMLAVGSEHGMSHLDLDRVKQELDKFGFDCIEVYQGIDRELFDAGIAKMCSLDEPPSEIVVARFERRK